MKLIIGNKNYSSWSLRAWLLLAAYDLDFEEVRVPLFEKDSTSALQAYSPAAKVPVLEDRGAVIWDSLAICEYVSEQYLNAAGWPAEAMSRAEARSCAAEMHSGFFALREAMPMNCRAQHRKVAGSAALEKDIRRIDAMWTDLRARYADKGPWLFGEFSIVDCMYAPVVMRFASYDVAVSAASAAYMTSLQAHKKMQDWMAAACAESEVIESEEVGN